MSISRRSKLDALKSRIDDITSDLREFVDAEQERYDNHSERWQESESARENLPTIGEKNSPEQIPCFVQYHYTKRRVVPPFFLA